jgi:hypothetical protein
VVSFPLAFLPATEQSLILKNVVVDDHHLYTKHNISKAVLITGHGGL